jgi:two-component system response regulator AtoC
MSVELGKSVTLTENAAFGLLMKYPWPGNVRELKNLVQRLLLTHDGSIGPDVIHESLFTHPGSSNAARADGVFFQDAESVLPLHDMEQDFRLKYFQFVRKNSTSDAEAAKKLGLAPPNYHRMCKELGLKP